jgi:hypothetical protein
MSVNISVSNNNPNNCNIIMKTMRDLNINCRIIETKSIVDKNIENGCLVTFDEQYNSKKNVRYLWDAIKYDYDCAHLKIDGLFDGCIYNYINANFCSTK